MACQAFSADSFTTLAGDSHLPILMHHASTSDCLPSTSHAHSMVSAGKLGSGFLLHYSLLTLPHHSPKPEEKNPLGSSGLPLCNCEARRNEVIGIVTLCHCCDKSQSAFRRNLHVKTLLNYRGSPASGEACLVYVYKLLIDTK